MSAGAFVPAIYSSDTGVLFPVRVQPETLTFELASAVNVQAIGPIAPDTPSARASGSRRELGVNCRLVRFRFTGAIPDGYLGTNAILTLPVLTKNAWDAYVKNSTGVYTLNGTAYPVAFVGKTPEKIN